MSKGKQPRPPAKVLEVEAQWERLSACTDNLEVGSEAAILERVRNSSLVECAGAENVTGLKPHTEAVDSCICMSGRGAFCQQ